MKNILSKTVVIYIIASAIAFIFDKIYALFSHGVSSSSMSNMFIWLLVCGALVFGVLRVLLGYLPEVKGFGLFYKLYNSGIAILIAGMLLQGILEISGGSSDYIKVYYFGAYGFMGVAVLVLIGVIVKGKNKE